MTQWGRIPYFGRQFSAHLGKSAGDQLRQGLSQQHCCFSHVGIYDTLRSCHLARFRVWCQMFCCLQKPPCEGLLCCMLKTITFPLIDGSINSDPGQDNPLNLRCTACTMSPHSRMCKRTHLHVLPFYNSDPLEQWMDHIQISDLVTCQMKRVLWWLDPQKHNPLCNSVIDVLFDTLSEVLSFTCNPAVIWRCNNHTECTSTSLRTTIRDLVSSIKH